MRLGPAGLRRREEARTVLGVWLVIGVVGNIQRCAAWGGSGFGVEMSSVWDLMNVRVPVGCPWWVMISQRDCLSPRGSWEKQ